MEQVLILANKDMNSVYSAILLEQVLMEDPVVKFPDNYMDELAFSARNYNVIVLLGFGVRENQVNHITEQLNEVLGVPFASVYHYATWGEEIPGAHSYITETDSFIVDLYNTFGTNKDENFIGKTPWNDLPHSTQKSLKGIIEGVNSYHTYNFEVSDTAFDLYIMHSVFREKLVEEFKAYGFLELFLGEYQPMIDAQKTIIEREVLKYVEQMKTAEVNGTIVAMTYADRYVNEVAHMIINSYDKYGYGNVIVFVGRHTRGDDLFSVRATPTIDAGEVCRKLNHGNGKPAVGTVFLGDAKQSTFNAVSEALREIL